MKVAILFPGQGAQEPGMGEGILSPGAPGHDLALEASDILDLDVVRLACDASEEELRATEVAQPLLLLISVARLRALADDVGGSIIATAGHSLGEYTGLVASKALSWQDALRLVRERGLAMAEAASADQGMSAVLGLDDATVESVLAGADGNGVAVAANFNAPGQVVISGNRDALESAGEQLKKAGARRVMPLSVGGAFHSPLMAAAAARLGRALDLATLDPQLPQAFNIDGGVRVDGNEVREALRAQLTSPVRWTACVASLVGLGVDTFLELGPGATLTAMGKRIAPDLAWRAGALS